MTLHVLVGYHPGPPSKYPPPGDSMESHPEMEDLVIPVQGRPIGGASAWLFA